MTSTALKNFRTCRRQDYKQLYPGGIAPSTGLIAVAYLHALCDHVTLFGFGGGALPTGHPFHYFKWMGTESSSGNIVHSFEAEEDLIHSLAMSGEIAVCKVEGCVGKRTSRMPGRKALMDLIPFVNSTDLPPGARPEFAANALADAVRLPGK
eukprot:1347354-Pyramimonas_sp.AAC.1